MSTRRRRGQCSRRVEDEGCGEGAWFVVELVRDGKLVEDDARCRFMQLDAPLFLDAEAGPYQQETSLVVASSHVADKLLLEVPVGPNASSFSFRDPVEEDVPPLVSDEKSESSGNAKDDAMRDEQDGHACGVMLCSLPQPSCSGDAHFIRVPYEFRFPDSVEYRIFKSALESILVQHKLVPRQVAVAQRLIALLKPPRAPPPKKHTTTTTATIDTDGTTTNNTTVSISKGPAMVNGTSNSCSTSNPRRKKAVVCAKAAPSSNGVCGSGNRKNSPKGRRLVGEDWSGADKEDEGLDVDDSCDEEEIAVVRQRPCACCMMMHPADTLSPHPTVPRSGWDGRLEVCPACKANLFKARQKAQAKQELYDPSDHHETLCAVCSRHWRRGNLTLYMCDSCSFSFCKACIAKVVSEHEYTALQKDDGSSWCCPGCRYSVPRLPHDAGTDDPRLQAGTHALSWLHRWGSAPLGAPPEPPSVKPGHGGGRIHSPVRFAPPLRLQGLSSTFSPVPDSPSPCASTSVFSSAFIKEEESDNPYKRPRPISTLTHTRRGRKLRATGAEDDDTRSPTSPHCFSSPSPPPLPPHFNGHTHSHTHTDVSSVSSLCATVSEGGYGRSKRGQIPTVNTHTHTHARAHKHGVCGDDGGGEEDDSEVEEDEPPLPPLDPKAFVPPRAAIWSVPVPPSASLTVQDLFLPISRSQLPAVTPTAPSSGRGKKQGPGRGGGRGRGGRGRGGRWANHIPKHKLNTLNSSSTTTSHEDGGLTGANGATQEKKADGSALTLTHALISSLSPTSGTAREARTRQSSALERFLEGEGGEEGEKGLGISGKGTADAHDTHVCALRPRTPTHTHAPAHTPRSGASESGSGKKQKVQATVEPPELPPVDDTKDHLDFFAAYVSYLKELPVPNRYTENTCFLCKDGGELLECDCDLKDKVTHCKKVYHEYCLGYEVSTDPNVRWFCPRHVCMTCADKKATVYFCRYCPNSACRDHVPQFSHVIRGHPKPRELMNSQLFEMVCAECVRLVIRARFREEVPRGFCAVVDEIEDTYMSTQLGEGLAFHPMIINRDRETRRRRQQEQESCVKDTSIEEEGLLPSAALITQPNAALASSSLKSSPSSAAAAAALFSSSSSKSTPRRDVSITANGLPN